MEPETQKENLDDHGIKVLNKRKTTGTNEPGVGKSEKAEADKEVCGV